MYRILNIIISIFLGLILFFSVAIIVLGDEVLGGSIIASFGFWIWMTIQEIRYGD